MARIREASSKRPKRWIVVQELPPDPAAPDKRRQRSRAHRTHRDAVATLTAWEAERERGAGPFADASAFTGGPAATSSTWTVADLLRHWLDDHAAHKVRPRSLYLYRETIERRLIPALGALQVRALTPPRIQAFYTKARREGMSDWALAQCHRRLMQALTMAERQGVIERNPAARVTPPSYRPRVRRIWTEEEARRFLAAATAPGASAYGPVWAMALTTGLRRGELTGLRWADLDFAAGVLRIRQAITRQTNYHLVAGETKTAAGVRTLGLSPALVAALRAHKVAQHAWRLAYGGNRQAYARERPYEDNDLVFASAAGTPVLPAGLRRDYLRLIERAGVPVITIHDARHTYASLALALGESVPAVSASLGHANPAITMRTYAHATPAQQAAVSSRMGDRLMGDGAGATGDETQNAPGDAVGGADRGR